jgi:hypothetical protein
MSWSSISVLVMSSTSLAAGSRITTLGAGTMIAAAFGARRMTT